MSQLDIIRNIPNPYKPWNNTKLSMKQFVGRQEELEFFDYMIDDFEKTSRLQNGLIIGAKSIGKTTLLEKAEQKLTNSFAVVKCQLSMYENIQPVEFFIELFDKVINEYEEWDGFLNSEEVQEWKNVIYGYAKEGSDYSRRVSRVKNLWTYLG